MTIGKNVMWGRGGGIYPQLVDTKKKHTQSTNVLLIIIGATILY